VHRGAICLNKKCVLLTRLELPTTANISKADQRTTNHAATTITESAESLVSRPPHAATSVGDTEEELENEIAQRLRNRGKRKNRSLSSVLICI
jgi:hypothetical protein